MSNMFDDARNRLKDKNSAVKVRSAENDYSSEDMFDAARKRLKEKQDRQTQNSMATANSKVEIPQVTPAGSASVADLLPKPTTESGGINIDALKEKLKKSSYGETDARPLDQNKVSHSSGMFTNVDDMNPLQRVWNSVRKTISGGLKSSLGSNVNTQGVAYQAGQKTRDAYYNDAMDQYQKGLDAAVQRQNYMKRHISDGKFTQEDVDAEQNYIDYYNMMLGAYGTGIEAQKGATQATYKLADKVSKHAANDIQSAKDTSYGGKFGEMLVDAGASTVQSSADALTSMLLTGYNPLQGITSGAPVAEVLKSNAANAKHTMAPFVIRAFGGGAQKARQEMEANGTANDENAFAKQVAYGVADAAKEWVTEKLDGIGAGGVYADADGFLDEFWDTVGDSFAENITKSAMGRKIISDLTSSFLGEGAEEAIGDYLEYIFSLSDIYGGAEETLAKDWKNGNGVGEKATNIAKGLANKLFDATEDFVVGGLSGVMGGAVKSVNEIAGTAAIGKDLRNMGAGTQPFIDTGMESLPGTESRELARMLQQKQDAGKNISNYELGALYNANVEAVSNEEKARQALIAEDAKRYAAANEQQNAEPAQTDGKNTVQQKQVGIMLPTAAENGVMPTYAQNTELSEIRKQAEETGTVTNSMAERVMQNQNAMQELGIDGNGKTKSQVRAEVKQAILDNSAKNDIIESENDAVKAEEEGLYGRAESNDGDGGRENAVYPAESGGELGSRAEEAEVRRPGAAEEVGRAGGQNHEDARPVSEYRSPAEYGIENGASAEADKTKTFREVASLSKEERKIADYGQKHGQNVHFFTGDLWLNGKKGTYKARGLISADGKDVWIKADHGYLSERQIYMHENYHAAIKANSAIREDGIRRIKEKYKGREEALKRLIKTYTDMYSMDGEGFSDDYVLEEILCDSHAGIDVMTTTENGGLEKVNLKRQADRALNAKATGKSDAKTETRYSRSVNGKNIAWVENSSLSANDLKNSNTIAEFIAEHIGEYYTIVESGNKVYIGEDLPPEYVYSKYSNTLKKRKPSLFKSKGKAANVLGDMIEIATNRRWEATKHPNSKDAKYGMYRYDTSFAFPVKSNSGEITGVKSFDAELVIRNASDGKKYLYDIVGIKENTADAKSLLDKEQRRLAAINAASHSGVYTNNVSQNDTESQEELKKKVSESDPIAPDDESRASREFDEDYMTAAEKANEKNKYADAKAMKQARKDRKTIHDYMEKIADMLPADITGNTFYSDSSYGGSEENSTVCVRSMAYEEFLDAVAEELGRPLTVEDTTFICQEAMALTDKPECMYCYVAMDRKAYREYLGNYIEQRDAFLADIRNGMEPGLVKPMKKSEANGSRAIAKDTAYGKFLNGRANTVNMYKRAQLWMDSENLITKKDLASIASMNRAARDPALRSQIADAQAYAQSASWAKKKNGFAAYNNHILKWSKAKVDKLNKHYGLRMYSFSDYSPAFILENMQQITDAAVKGLKVLGYTKELDFVRIFAPTGMNINISVFGYNDRSTGNIAMDAMQGADWEQAKALRDQYDNVGCTFVATNDAQVEWALEQDWIDVVIPFHIVRTGANVASMFGWKNYTDMSADKKNPNWEKGNAKSIYPSEHQNDRDLYLELCEENNLTPRFEQWVENPNYMKLVNETRRSDAETKPVQPIFDMTYAEASLDEMVKRGGYIQHLGGSSENMRLLASETAEKINGKTKDEVRSEVENRARSSREIDEEDLDDAFVSDITSEEFDREIRKILDMPIEKRMDALQNIEERVFGVKSDGEDANGKKLSEAQNKFFSRSTVRNKTGKLLPVYHYTNSEFTKFENRGASVGSNRTLGDGYYVSTNSEEFKSFGRNKMVMYANIVNPFEMELTKAQANEVYDKYFKKHHPNDRGNTYRDHVIGKLQSSIRVFDYLKEAAETNGTTTSKILSDLGFDGVHSGIEWVAFSSNQLKQTTNLNPTENEDIRYSREADDNYAKIYQQNKRLKKQVEYWKQQTKATTEWKADAKQEAENAKSILKSVSSKANADDVTKRITKLHEDMSNGRLTYEDGKAEAVNIAADIVNKSSAMVSKDVESYNEAKRIFRSTAQTDVAYKQLQQMFGEDMFPRAITTREMLENINEYFDLVKPIAENPYDLGKAMIIEDVANDIVDSGMEIRQAKPTVIDKERAKAAEAKDKAKRSAEEQRLVDAMYYGRLLAEERAKHKEALAKERGRTAEVKAQAKADAKQQREISKAELEVQKQTDDMYYGRKLSELRKQKDAKIEGILQHQREVVKNRREARQEASDRNRLLKIVRRLNGKKIDPTTRSMLPDIVKELDTVAVNITGKTLENLSDLRDWYNEKTDKNSADYDPNFTPDNATKAKLDRLEKAMRGRTIGDMPIEDVCALTEVLQNIEHNMLEGRKFQNSQVKIDNYNAAMHVINDVENAKSGKIDRKLNPLRAVRRIVGYADGSIAGTTKNHLITLTEEMIDGGRKAKKYESDNIHRFDKWLSDKQFMRDLYGKHAKSVYINGVNVRTGEIERVEITPAMRISLYLHSLNDDNMRHIQGAYNKENDSYNGGGLLIPDMKEYRKGNMEKAYAADHRIKLTKANVNAICAKMDAKEVAFAKAMHTYFNEIAPKALNEASVLIDGYEKFNVDNYFPISVDKNFLSQDFEGIKVNEDGSLTHPGFGEERIQSSKPIYLRDVNTVLMTAIRQNSMYAYQAVPLMNMSKLLNVQSIESTDSVQAALGRKYGDGSATRYIKKFMQDYAGNKNTSRDDKAFSRIRSNYAGGVLTLSAGTAIKQAASYPGAAAILRTGSLVKGITGKLDVSFIDEMTSTYTRRKEGFSNIELAEMAQQGKHIPAALNWIQAVDVATTNRLKQACAYEVMADGKFTPGTMEYKKAVVDLYNRVIEETQPNYSAELRPDILRSDNAMLRSLVMFATQPMQNFGILYDAIGNYSAKRTAYQNSKSKETEAALKDAGKSLGKAVGSQVAAGVVFSLMQYIWDAWRKKDEKYEDENGDHLLSYLFNVIAGSRSFDAGDFLNATGSTAKGLAVNMAGNVGGMFIGGKAALDFAESIADAFIKKVTGKKIFNAYNGGLEVPEFSVVGDMMSGALKIVNTINDDSSDSKKILTTVWDLTENVGNALGVPIANVTTDITSIAKNIITVMNANEKYVGNYFILKLDTANNQACYQNLWKCYKNGTRSELRKLYREMLDDGFTDTQIKNAMETRMKEEQGVKSVDKLTRRWEDII